MVVDWEGSALMGDPAFGPEFRGEVEPKLRPWDRLEPSPFIPFLKEKLGDDYLEIARKERYRKRHEARKLRKRWRPEQRLMGETSVELYGTDSCRESKFAGLLDHAVGEAEARELLPTLIPEQIERTSALVAALKNHEVPMLFDPNFKVDSSGNYKGMRVAKAIRIQGSYALVQGETDEAKEMVLGLERLAQGYPSETQTGFALRWALRGQMMDLIEEGLFSRRWSPGDLREFDQVLRTWQVWEDQRTSILGEVKWWHQLFQSVFVKKNTDIDVERSFGDKIIVGLRLYELEYASVQEELMDGYETFPEHPEMAWDWIKKFDDVDDDRSLNLRWFDHSLGGMARHAVRLHCYGRLLRMMFWVEEFYTEHRRYPSGWEEIPEELWLYDLASAERKRLIYEVEEGEEGEEGGRPVLSAERASLRTARRRIRKAWWQYGKGIRLHW